MLYKLIHRSDRPGELIPILNGETVYPSDFIESTEEGLVIKPANFIVCGKYEITCEEYYELANDFINYFEHMSKRS